MRILLIEDDPGNAEVVDEILTDEGHDVRRAASLAEATEHLAASSWDVVITDSLEAPGTARQDVDIEGYHALARRAAVIVMSAQPWARHIAAEELGVSAVLPKPFMLEDLLEAVRSAEGSR